MTRRAFAKVLCEGLQDALFARRVLLRLGIGERDLRIEYSPRGRGSGEQYVREHYPEDLEAHRVRQAKRRAVLVVLTDADTRSVAATLDHLAEAVANQNLAPRCASDAVAILIPRRNIETWLTALEGAPVDETTAYPKRSGRESQCQSAVDRFIALLAAATDAVQPPSLAQGLRELQPLVAVLKAG